MVLLVFVVLGEDLQSKKENSNLDRCRPKIKRLYLRSLCSEAYFWKFIFVSLFLEAYVTIFIGRKSNLSVH